MFNSFHGATLALPLDKVTDDLGFLVRNATLMDIQACRTHGLAVERTLPEVRSRIQEVRDDMALIKSRRRKKRRSESRKGEYPGDAAKDS